MTRLMIDHFVTKIPAPIVVIECEQPVPPITILVKNKPTEHIEPHSCNEI